MLPRDRYLQKPSIMCRHASPATELSLYAIIHCSQTICGERLQIKRTFSQLLTFCSFALLASVAFAQMHVLVNHVGYETTAPKQALVVADEKDAQLASPQTFSL